MNFHKGACRNHGHPWLNHMTAKRVRVGRGGIFRLWARITSLWGPVTGTMDTPGLTIIIRRWIRLSKRGGVKVLSVPKFTANLYLADAVQNCGKF